MNTQEKRANNSKKQPKTQKRLLKFIPKRHSRKRRATTAITINDERRPMLHPGSHPTQYYLVEKERKLDKLAVKEAYLKEQVITEQVQVVSQFDKILSEQVRDLSDLERKAESLERHVPPSFASHTSNRHTSKDYFKYCFCCCCCLSSTQTEKT